MNVSGWRAALRIARREAWRARGRSLLIVLMVALPVFAACAADITYRSQQLSLDERLERRIGQADALVWSPHGGGGPVVQDPADGDRYESAATMPEWTADTIVPDVPPERVAEPPRPDVPSTIPAGSTVLGRTNATVSLRTKYGLASADFLEFDYAAKPAKGIFRQTAGRAPRTTDEVVVTEAFLSAGGLKIGGVLSEAASGKRFTVVGTFAVPDDLDARRVIARPGALLDHLHETTGLGLERRFLVDAPPGAYRWDAVKALNQVGIVATSREAAHQDLPDREVPFRARDHGPSQKLGDLALAVTVVVIGMALLEIVLLAGPGFAVGARRRKRDLGLVGVVGGDRRHIRTIVLADGVVLGLVAGVLGTATGMAAAWFSRDWFSRTAGEQIGRYDVRPLELLGIALFGLVIGVVAAAVPAFLAARESVVDALTGRRGVRRGSRILPLTGAALAAVGLGLAYYGARVSPSDAVTLAGCVIAQLGLIACCPALVGAAGRLGRFLPLTARLAVRDAARNRPRSAPAVAAIMAAIAGATAVMAYWASTDHDDRESYAPQARHGQVSVLLYDDAGRQAEQMAKAIEANLPVAGGGVVRGFPEICTQGTCLLVRPVQPPQNRCPLIVARSGFVGDQPGAEAESRPPTRDEVRAARDDPRCQPDAVRVEFESRPIPVGDADLVRRLTGSTDPRIAEALRHGAVVFDKGLIADGKLTLETSMLVQKGQDGQDGQPEVTPHAWEALPAQTIVVPAVYVETGEHPRTSMVLGEEAAAALGTPPQPIEVRYDTREMPSEAAEQRTRDALSGFGSGYFFVERGHQGRPSLQILLLASSAIIVALGAAGVATGLALADGRRDLATLGAVGAPPRVRRILSAAQSWVIAVIGTALGVVVGLLPAAALRWKTAAVRERWRDDAIDAGEFLNVPDLPGTTLVVPWAQMGLALVAVPLLAALVAAVFTRSRESMRRRGSG